MFCKKTSWMEPLAHSIGYTIVFMCLYIVAFCKNLKFQTFLIFSLFMQKQNLNKTLNSNRKFQEKWKINYFCEYISNSIFCLICYEKISMLKEYNIKRHYETKHKERYHQLEGKLRKEKFEQLK